MVSESGRGILVGTGEVNLHLILLVFSFGKVLLSERTSKFVQRVGRKRQSLDEGMLSSTMLITVDRGHRKFLIKLW